LDGARISQTQRAAPLTIILSLELQMLLGCSDARVPANEIMGEECGSVFVVRNVANLVVSTDFNLMGALQYAVNVLKVPHIIVCGHYDCGGVRASMERKDKSPPLENWLRNIRDV
jgi:carbonic anhydrase